MDCRIIRDRLSEYVDGMLGEGEASQVKNHLAQCAKCSEAYRSMTTIIDHMQRMESIEEPADFLQKVNARMDRSFSSAGIIRRFFRPLRIKIPLELAAAAAVIALIVYLGGVKEPKQLYQITITERDEFMVTDGDALEIESGTNQKSDTPGSKPDESEGVKREFPAAERKADKKAGSEQKPVPVKNEDVKMAEAAEKPPPVEEISEKGKGTARESAPPKSEADRIAVTKLTPAPAEQRLDKRPDSTRQFAPAEIGDAKITITTRKLAEAGRGLEEAANVAKESAPLMRGAKKGATAETRAKKGSKEQVSLQDTIRSLGGNVIEVQYLEDTELPRRMIVEIPVGKFEFLIQELVRLGDIQAPPAEIKRKADELIRVELIFIRSTP